MATMTMTKNQAESTITGMCGGEIDLKSSNIILPCYHLLLKYETNQRGALSRVSSSCQVVLGLCVE